MQNPSASAIKPPFPTAAWLLGLLGIQRALAESLHWDLSRESVFILVLDLLRLLSSFLSCCP